MPSVRLKLNALIQLNLNAGVKMRYLLIFMVSFTILPIGNAQILGKNILLFNKGSRKIRLTWFSTMLWLRKAILPYTFQTLVSSVIHSKGEGKGIKSARMAHFYLHCTGTVMARMIVKITQMKLAAKVNNLQVLIKFKNIEQ